MDGNLIQPNNISFVNRQAVRILDPDFTLVCEIEDYESLSFTRKYSTYGSFEMTISRHKHNAIYLERGRILYLSPEKTGFIDYRESVIGGAEKQTKGDEVILIKGYTLEKILSDRITDVPSGSVNWTFNGNLETGIKTLIDYNAGENANMPSRTINELLISESKERGSNVALSYRYKNLSEMLTNLSDAHGLGHKITLDYTNKKFVYDVYEGENLTTTQRDKPPVIFSTDFGNINNQTLTDSRLDYKNTAFVAGQGEGADRATVWVNEGDITETGLARREIFIDARDVEQTSNLPARGKDKLGELAPVYTVEGTIRPYNTFRFEQDYNLGDQVTITFNDIGNQVSLDTRITEVSEYWGNTGYDVEMTFGNKVPNIIDKLIGMINDNSVESST